MAFWNFGRTGDQPDNGFEGAGAKGPSEAGEGTGGGSTTGTEDKGGAGSPSEGAEGEVGRRVVVRRRGLPVATEEKVEEPPPTKQVAPPILTPSPFGPLAFAQGGVAPRPEESTLRAAGRGSMRVQAHRDVRRLTTVVELRIADLAFSVEVPTDSLYLRGAGLEDVVREVVGELSAMFRDEVTSAVRAALASEARI